MLVLLWPKYYGGASGADPGDPFGRKGKYLGPAQLLESDALPRRSQPTLAELETHEEPESSPRAVDWFDQTAIAEALFKIEQLAKEIDDARARSILLQTLLAQLNAQLMAAEEEEFALFLMMTH